MAKQRSLDIAYMKCALAISELSVATRKKVGAILVAPNGGIIGEGFNGTPAGFDNACEECGWHVVMYVEGDFHWYCPQCRKEITNDERKVRVLDGGTNYSYHDIPITKSEVLHAESNAITKVARSSNSSQGATLYCTLAPCFECAKLIIQAGIVRVLYHEHYPYPGHTGPMRTIGLDLLEKANIRVDILPSLTHNDSNDLP